ncbi:MAG: SOS response-associated peptidase [Terriglobales bacterium]
MCGRFRLGKGREALKKFFAAEIDGDWDPRYNVAPGQNVATVRQDPAQPVRRLSLMRWGLIPFWAKEAAIGYKMINARSETVAEKPAYRDALKSRRCLIAADGFYEWQKLGKAKQPYCFTTAEEGIFAFAGIWDRWKSPEGQTIETCSILTTSANDLVRDVHYRMPVILPPESFDLWLDPGFTNREGIVELLKPFAAGAMKKYPISTRVNSVKNDDEECAARVEAAGA